MDYALKSLSLIKIENKNGYDLSYNVKFIVCEGKTIVYNNEGSINRIKVSENIFVNVSKKDLNKEMLKILNKKID